MTLEPFFALTPQQPWYNCPSAEESAPGVTAFVNVWNMSAQTGTHLLGKCHTKAARFEENCAYSPFSAATKIGRAHV